MEPKSFIPIDRRRAISRDEGLHDYVDGAVLFADIGGFTGIAEKLAHELGAVLGAEELTYHLNRIFSVMIMHVHACHGSVIYFNGDAITCWFDSDHCRGAVYCALTMQKQLADFSEVVFSNGSRIRLGFKISVCSGQARRFLIGDPGIQVMDFIGGKLLNRVAAAEELIQSDNIIIGAELLSFFGNSIDIKEWISSAEGEHFAVGIDLLENFEPTSLEEDVLLTKTECKPWIHRHVYYKILSQNKGFIAEFRSPAIIFMNFEGIDYDKDRDAGLKLDAFIKKVQNVFNRYEAILLQVIFGDKGSYIYGAFGPLISHENDIFRAVEASIKLTELETEFDYVSNIRIGINRGEVYAGTYGSGARRTFGILGNEVNIAARLMGLANPGNILVTEAIEKTASSVFNFETIGIQSFKGLRNPLPVFRVSPQQPQDARLSIKHDTTYPMLGRDAELNILENHLHLLKKGDGSIVVIEGDAGIGKSRLIADLVERSDTFKIPVLMAAGDSINSATSYYAWRDIFRKIFNIDQIDHIAATTMRIEGKLRHDPFLITHMPLLNAVLPLNIPENEATRLLTGKSRSDKSLNFLTLIISERISQLSGPLLLILEDAHWFDSSSWALASQLRESLPAIMIVVVTRPKDNHINQKIADLKRSANATEIRLEPLNTDDVVSLVRQRLSAGQLPQEFIDILKEKGDGNPFFCEEIAYSLRDSGLIAVEDGIFRLSAKANLRQGVVSTYVRDIITSRIDGLLVAQQSVLKTASIIGRVFSFSMLRDIYESDSAETQLLGHLDSLDQLSIIQKLYNGIDLSYMFRQILTQEVIYNLMLFSQREKLHREVAGWYEKKYAGELAAYCQVLAYHFERSDDKSRAISYLESSGEMALQNYANEEAVAFYSRLLKLVDANGFQLTNIKKAQCEFKLGEAWVNLLNYPEGSKHIVKGLSLAYKPIPSSKAGLILGITWQVTLQALCRLFPKKFVGRKADQKAILQMVSRAYENLTEIYFVTGKHIPSYYTGFCLLNVSEAVGTSPELARSYASLGAGIGFVPLHKLADIYCDKALQTLDDIDDLPTRCYTKTVVGLYYGGMGRWEKSQELITDAIGKSEQIGDSRRNSDALSVLIPMNYFTANFSAGEALSRELYELNRGTPYLHNLCESLYLLTGFLLEFEYYDEADQTLGEFEHILSENEEISDKFLLMGLWSLKTIYYLRKQEYQQCANTALDIMQIASKYSPSFFSSLMGFSCPADIFLSLWELGFGSDEMPVRKYCKKGLRLIDKFSNIFPIGKPRALLLRGRFCHIQKKYAKAMALWTTGAALAAKMKMPYEHGLILFEMAKHLDLNNPERRRQLTESICIFENCGASYSLSLAKQALGERFDVRG